MIDLTGHDKIAHLVEPLRIIDRRAEAAGSPYLVVGAAARDVLLHAVHGVQIRRLTTDLDVAVAVADWSAFETLRSTFPHASGSPEHRVTVAEMTVDLVPFGGVERVDRTIAWPPAEDSVMSAFGLAEALTTAEEIRLAPDLVVRVASLPAQAVLKLTAWEERHFEKPRHDSADLQLILKSYGPDCNVDRLYVGDGVPMLERADYDLEIAGAMLLGADVRRMLPPSALAHFGDLLTATTSDTSGLADDMPGDRDANAELLDAFRAGVEQPI
ncbi:nucleotidyl transferase AbiEii/AbiGii toxin family protein [Jiangella sp. DSM 45060]|uniref:nucleotidyl transferase AbiEii/AbiGii toxin family protein n=1 Tax=Jiangella sp. DSM 45060 TaxID=1798224 RepID=UPI00087D81E9|nr:nucleotidyl transferase AbiEii/AbiGii toxin family protein [Jiangella sp. DSM 45060]SDS35722.1 Predicted nucleotidyltransferase [Jiangella sp. DSM 45060]